MQHKTNSKFNESLKFVARHYREGAFRRDLSFLPAVMPWWRRHGVAAAVAGVALVAAAAVATFTGVFSGPTASEAPADTIVAAPAVARPDTVAAPVSLTISFTDAPLSRVVAEIESNYHVTVANVPDGDSRRLTLSYEGTAADLVATINDLLGTEMEVRP